MQYSFWAGQPNPDPLENIFPTGDIIISTDDNTFSHGEITFSTRETPNIAVVRIQPLGWNIRKSLRNMSISLFGLEDIVFSGPFAQVKT